VCFIYDLTQNLSPSSPCNDRQLTSKCFNVFHPLAAAALQSQEGPVCTVLMRAINNTIQRSLYCFTVNWSCKRNWSCCYDRLIINNTSSKFQFFTYASDIWYDCLTNGSVVIKAPCNCLKCSVNLPTSLSN
jgi:hypothetical protein